MILFWHRDEPIGICVFASPAASLAARSAAFGLVNPRSETALAALNANLWLLQRVVLHPTYRGAGLAAPFVRRACAFCPVDWIETLSVLGRINPFFERAGFVRRGAVTPKSGGSRAGCYGGRATARASRPIAPAYYLFDNRDRPIALANSGATR